MSSAADVFRIVHAGHEVIEVGVVCGDAANPPLICLDCHEEQGPPPTPPGGHA